MQNTTAKLNDSRPVITIPANDTFHQPMVEGVNRAGIPQSDSSFKGLPKTGSIGENHKARAAKGYSSHESNIVFSD